MISAALATYNHTSRQQVPDVVLKTLKGERIELQKLKGRPVLINFWSSECAPCLREMPELSRLQRDFSARGLTVIAIAMSYDMPSRVVEFAQAGQYPFAFVLDLDASLSGAFNGVNGVPESFLIAPNGEIAFHRLGSLDFEKLRAQIEILLAEA